MSDDLDLLCRTAAELCATSRALRQQSLETRLVAAQLKADYRADHIKHVQKLAALNPRAALQLARIMLSRDSRVLSEGGTGY